MLCPLESLRLSRSACDTSLRRSNFPPCLHLNPCNAPDFAALSRRFGLSGTLVHAAPHGSGHINDTFAVTHELAGVRTRHILQRINDSVFRQVPELMENIVRVTSHQRHRLEAAGVDDSARRALAVIPADSGAPYWENGDGRPWRCYRFIEGARTYDQVESPLQAREAARAFARFQKLLVDLPGGRLHETIPNFHHTRDRFARFAAAVNADPCNRAAGVRSEIAFLMQREADCAVVVDAIAAGTVPERVTHNDTKLNNVMMDEQTGEGICVIDLDTVMPGSLLYDFGDMVRTATNPAAEDDAGSGRVRMEMGMFEALVAGFLEEAAEVMVPAEVELLAFSGKLLTLELALRFLTDHLQGDAYFRIHRRHHNLDRARAQIELVRSIEAQQAAMEACVRRALGGTK